MKLFEFDDYKEYIRQRLRQMPGNGHGEFKKISEVLKIHTTRISHVFRGDVHLTLEQACDLARYLGMNDLETEYFLKLVQKDRAGTVQLKRVMEKELEAMKERSQELVHRVERDRTLTEEEKANFYSSWYYTGIQLATALVRPQTLETLSHRFDIPRERVRLALDFLIRVGMCEEESGSFKMKPLFTHLESGSPLVARHHANWRIQAIQKHEKLNPNELAYTAPMVLAKKDLPVVKEMAMEFVQKVIKLVKNSDPNEALACLCLDWFEF